jgi:DNA-binding beta-propeller fold protein YncE
MQWLDERRVVVTAEGLGSLLLVDTAAAEVTAQIPVDQSVSHMLTLAPDGERAFVANIGDGSVSVISLAGRHKLADFRAGEGTEGIAVVGGRELWVSNRQDGSIRVFDLESMATLATLPLGGFPIRVEADDARGRVYVTQAVGDSLAVFDVASRELLQRVDFSGEAQLRRTGGSTLSQLSKGSIPVGVLLAGSGDRLYVAHTQSDAISVIDAQSLELQQVLKAGDEPDGMAWSARRTAVSLGTSAGGR